MSDIKVNIIGQFDKRGFDQADKATNKLGKSFDKLAKRLGAALTIGAIAKFSKAAVTAFAEDDKAAKQLTRTYQNLGLAFEGAIVNDYIDQLQRATGVADTQLRPALSTLTQATLDYGKAQQLLGVAMDISAATGNDLETVSKALAKAQLGQLTALAKLNVGITTAEAKTLTFDQAIEKLSGRFKGSAKGAAESYEGQINRLKVAADEAQESLGKKLVTAINILSNGKNLDSVSNIFQKMADNAGNMAIGIAKTVAELNKVPGAAKAGGWIDKFNSFMEKLNLFTYLRDKGAAVATGLTTGTRLGAPGALAAAKENARILAENRKEQARILALQKAQAAEQAKQKRLKQISLMLTQKEAKFDLQRIQLAAAAQGKLTAEERKRVEELQIIEELKAAIAADDLNKAEELLKQLNTLQTKTFDLANALTSLSTIPSPFSSWKDEITDVTDSLNNNAKKAVNDFLATFRMGVNIISKEMEAFSFASQAEADMLLGDYYAALAQLQESEANLELLYSQFSGNLVAGLSISEKRLIDQYFASGAQGMLDNPYRSDVDLNAIIDAIKASNELYKTVRPTIDATNAQRDSVAALAQAAADAALLAANDLLNESITANLNMGLTPSINVTVNNAGSVITQSDLVESITDGIYQYQKAGKGILLSSTNI